MESFERQISENVYADGVQFEASLGYHTVVMRDIYELVALLDRLNKPYNGRLKQYLEKMMEFDHTGNIVNSDLAAVKKDADILSFGGADYKKDLVVLNGF